MKELNFMDVAREVMEKIRKGAFLTVQSDDGLNTMTIGWATIGFVWQRPIVMVAVRPTRHTFGIIEKAADFTLSVPFGNMHKETTFCGTKSGRDVDKFKACNLKTRTGQQTISPIIDIAGIHLECRIVFKAAMRPDCLDAACERALYPRKDYHTLYFGEILACYEIQ